MLTSLYPSAPFPVEGVFAERRWAGMRERGHEVSVTHPVPHAPWPLVRGARARLARIPHSEVRRDIEIRAPRYVHLPGRALGNARRFARAGLRSALGGPGPDVVVCDYAWPASCAAPELSARGVPCVVSGRGSDVLQVAGEAGLGAHLAHNLRCSGHWIGVSSDLVARMDELGGGAGTLVPNGVDLERFRPRERAGARAELGLDGTAPLVLVVGHLIPRKDPLLALAAFESGAPADARLVFLGDGELREALTTAAGSSAVGDRVELRGEVPPEQLATWYAAADCLLLTSRREGRPNVVLEALASGCPVVATEAGGTGELLAELPADVPDGLVPAAERSPEAVGRRLGAMLASPPDADALRAVVEPLSWERSLDALEGALEVAMR